MQLILLFLYQLFHIKGLILSNALRAQKNAEDESYEIAFNNLRTEVIKLRNEALEKDKILVTLVDKIKENEAASKAQVAAQKHEIDDLRKPYPVLLQILLKRLRALSRKETTKLKRWPKQSWTKSSIGS